MLEGRASGLTSRVQLLAALSLAIGAISTLATAFAFFWFVKIKRSFRHDLIMLLVQADFIKSAAFVIFPIVQFVHGPVPSESPFCNFSGFMLSFGIEASDLAVVLIALHSAMYIRRPRSGLNPYRWWAYAAYIVIPVILASLAFADGGYDNLGSYCYLATDHGWSRLALSWIPRYVLMSFIVATYLCIYIYVRTRIDRYGRKASTTHPSMTSARRPGRADRMASVSGESTDQFAPSSAATTDPIRWTIPFYSGASSNEGHAITDDQDPHFTTGPGVGRSAFPFPDVPVGTRCSSATAVTASVSSSRPTIRKATHASIANSSPRLQVEEDTSRSSTGPPDDVTQGNLSDAGARHTGLSSVEAGIELADVSSDTAYRQHDEPHSSVARNRERIRRQLRSLVYYPLIYLVTWLFPLINQTFRHRGQPRPLWLSALSIIGFSVQGFANVAVFMSREKPWRHRAGSKGFWVGVRGKLWGGSITAYGGGRTPDDMMLEARAARARRAVEMAEESKAQTGVAQTQQPLPENSNRNWWDIDNFDLDTDWEDGDSHPHGK
ncbi:G protein-coupled glucose receptor regulating Gpa2-domain-containing protein [Coniochaeta sp. 2T2.1]|nr:G protein-coupled glucose receptor regulating Gpa2-domain-containing protein [Coniochaeta sp. 2T2.1]